MMRIAKCTAWTLLVASALLAFSNDGIIVAWPTALAKRRQAPSVRQKPSRSSIFSKTPQLDVSTNSLNANAAAAADDNPKKFNFGPKERQDFLKATKSGLAVSLAMVPEAVAFAFVAGVSPLVGLWTTVVLGFFAAALGGRAGLCSSASGACSVVVAALSASHGPAYLSACAIMAGMLQIAGGTAGVGKLLKLIPHPVMLGFVNGLAIVMTKAQLMHFKTGGTFMSLTTPLGASTYGIAALTMALVKLIPKVTKAVPPSLGAVAISSFVAKFFSLPAKTLADVAGAATFKGGLSVLPSFGLPSVPLTWETVQIVFPYALTMASVGVLESLLTMQILDDMADDGKRGSSKKECIGQGTGNIMSGLTQGIGGCVLLGQSIINMQSGGGVSRWSGMSMALLLATGIVAAAPLLANVPVSALVGVMLLVCQSTFSWSSLRLISKIPKLDAAVIALVSIVTFQKDLAVAVLAGTMLSALGFAYKQSSALTATYSVDEKSGVKTYKLQGPLFFGSTQKFEELFSSARSDPSEVRLDFSESRVLDHSGMESLETLSSKYAAMGKTVKVENLCMDSTKVLAKYSKGRRDALPFQFSADTDVENGTMRQNSSGKAQAAATKTW